MASTTRTVPKKRFLYAALPLVGLAVILGIRGRSYFGSGSSTGPRPQDRVNETNVVQAPGSLGLWWWAGGKLLAVAQDDPPAPSSAGVWMRGYGLSRTQPVPIIIRREDHQIVFRYEGPDRLLAWSPNGKWLLAGPGFGHWTHQSEVRLMETAHPDRPCLVVEKVEHAWAWSPDSRYLALEAEGLRLIQLDRRLESGEVPFPAPVEVDDVSGLAWSPDSRQLLYLTEGKLRLLDPEQPPPRTLMKGLGDVYWGWVAWSPDGNQATIVPGEEQSTMWLWRRVDGQRTRVPFPEECKQMDPRGISWSPDSSRFAVEWNEDTRSVLYLVEATHGTRWKAFEVKVRMGGVGIFGPVWSPDGKTLALIACTYRSNERSLTSRLVAGRLWLVRPQEQRIQGLWPRQLRGSMPTSTCLAWTPDGRELLLVAEGPQQRRLVSLAVDGSEVRFLTGEEEFVLETAVSPDGRWIAFEHGSLRRREGEVSWFSGDTGGVSETPYHFDIQTDVSVMRWDGTQRVSLGAVLKGSGQEGN